jgi:hypothetical protein
LRHRFGTPSGGTLPGSDGKRNIADKIAAGFHAFDEVRHVLRAASETPATAAHKARVQAVKFDQLGHLIGFDEAHGKAVNEFL